MLRKRYDDDPEERLGAGRILGGMSTLVGDPITNVLSGGRLNALRGASNRPEYDAYMTGVERSPRGSLMGQVAGGIGAIAEHFAKPEEKTAGRELFDLAVNTGAGLIPMYVGHKGLQMMSGGYRKYSNAFTDPVKAGAQHFEESAKANAKNYAGTMKNAGMEGVEDFTQKHANGLNKQITQSEHAILASNSIKTLKDNSTIFKSKATVGKGVLGDEGILFSANDPAGNANATANLTNTVFDHSEKLYEDFKKGALGKGKIRPSDMANINNNIQKQLSLAHGYAKGENKEQLDSLKKLFTKPVRDGKDAITRIQDIRQVSRDLAKSGDTRASQILDNLSKETRDYANNSIEGFTESLNRADMLWSVGKDLQEAVGQDFSPERLIELLTRDGKKISVFNNFLKSIGFEAEGVEGHPLQQFIQVLKGGMYHDALSRGEVTTASLPQIFTKIKSIGDIGHIRVKADDGILGYIDNLKKIRTHSGEEGFGGSMVSHALSGLLGGQFGMAGAIAPLFFGSGKSRLRKAVMAYLKHHGHIT